MKKWDNKKTEDLIRAILALKNRKESKMFLRDLLTEKELLEFGNRWKAVQMLNEGISYSKIEKETSLSSTTVARISKWFQKGTGGYGLMLNRISKKHHKASSNSKKRLI
ncbi:MAG TPA: YerC/YecD family TrpR-related protein [Candidatus Moranbacteria bacterium]|nr:YerC/YecD family TrpR-related protein [Candidatus Moranbacteria bacterium]